MIKNSLILIGKRSFIGSNIYNLLKKNNKIKLVSLNEFLQLKTSYINKYDYLYLYLFNNIYFSLYYTITYF